MLPGDEKRNLSRRKEKIICMKNKLTITLYINDPMGKR